MKPDRKALRQLRDFLAKVPEASFEWSQYVASEDDLDDFPTEKALQKHVVADLQEIGRTQRPHCGTTACVAGWAAICHPRRLKVNSWGVQHVHFRRLRGGDAFARAYSLTKEQVEPIVYGFTLSRYENNKAGALAALDDLLASLR